MNNTENYTRVYIGTFVYNIVVETRMHRYILQNDSILKKYLGEYMINIIRRYILKKFLKLGNYLPKNTDERNQYIDIYYSKDDMWMYDKNIHLHVISSNHEPDKIFFYVDIHTLCDKNILTSIKNIFEFPDFYRDMVFNLYYIFNILVTDYFKSKLIRKQKIIPIFDFAYDVNVKLSNVKYSDSKVNFREVITDFVLRTQQPTGNVECKLQEKINNDLFELKNKLESNIVKQLELENNILNELEPKRRLIQAKLDREKEIDDPKIDCDDKLDMFTDQEIKNDNLIKIYWLDYNITHCYNLSSLQNYWNTENSSGKKIDRTTNPNTVYYLLPKNNVYITQYDKDLLLNNKNVLFLADSVFKHNLNRNMNANTINVTNITALKIN